MSDTTYWLGRIAVLLLVGSVFGLGWTQLSDGHSPARLLLSRYLHWLEKKLAFLRSRRTGRGVVITQGLTLLLCVVTALLLNEGSLLLFLPVLAFAWPVSISRKVARRTALFDEQIELWLGAISNSLKASPSLGEAIASTIPLVPAPMSEEVDVLVKEHELGTPLDRALDNMAERINTKTLAATVLALKVARRSGGNLPAMLDGAAAALRELARLEGVVRTKTAEGRAQAWVIGAIPVPMIGGLSLIDPDFFTPLFSNFAGQFVIVIAGILWLTAILAAMKILAVDI